MFATIGLFAEETMGGGGLLSYDTLVLAASGAAVGIFALVQKIHKAKTFCIGPKNLQCKHILCIDPINNLLGQNIFRFPKFPYFLLGYFHKGMVTNGIIFSIFEIIERMSRNSKSWISN